MMNEVMDGKLNILLVEDAALDAELTLGSLADGGLAFDVVRVDTEEAFRRELVRPGLALILSDYSLPRFTGFAALDLAREHRPEVPFIFVSGALGEENAVEMLKRGATDYVLKQRLDRLVPAVRRATAEAAERAERRRAEAALRDSEARFRFLSELGERTRDLTDPEQVMAVIARALGEHLRVSRCAYAEVEADSDRFTIRHDYTADGCASTTGDYRLALFGPRAAADQRAGRTLVIADVDAELAPAEGADTFNAIGIKAVVCCPLVRQGRLAAMMAVHQVAPRRWTAAEVGLLEAVVERSWAYIERARVARALARSEAEFRQLADAMPQIVWAARPDGTLDYYNRRWFEYVDLPEGAADEARWDRYIHPDDLPGVYDAWSAAVRDGHTYAVEFRVRRADGAYRWFLVRALPVRDARGHTTRWFGTCTDIEDRKRGEEERQALLESEQAARAESDRASRAKDEFLATLSHEVRTPLNAILGWATILAGGSATESDLREGLDAILRNARAQTQIIEDLLDMSRIVSGKVRLEVQRTDLAALVRSALDTVRPAADAKGLRVSADVDGSAGPINADPNRLQQVFWNLLNNAVKFTPRGGQVRVSLERVNSSLEVRVADTGEGIRPEFLPHAFDRFRQADASTTRHHGGLGLGLAIVKQLVELHGGTVRVTSPGVGKGTTFTVALPVCAIVPELPAAPGDRGQPAGSGPPPVDPDQCMQLAGVRVLVVDDEPDARALIKRLLDDCNAVVRVAASAGEAMELMLSERPDVLVSDIGMPGEDGYSLIRRVRSLESGGARNVPAVALTAYARSEDRVRAMRAGYQTHVVKPVEPVELITVIASLAGRAKA